MLLLPNKLMIEMTVGKTWTTVEITSDKSLPGTKTAKICW